MYNDLRLICFNIFLTQVGNVFDQNETYDCGVNGDLLGLVVAAPAAPVAEDAEPGDDWTLDGDACESMAALLTMEEAAESALAKFGRDPLDGDRTEANGDEAAAETTLEAKFEADELDPAPIGRVCM